MAFAKKIPLHHQLPDLGVQLLDLTFADTPDCITSPGERANHPVDGLPVPGRDHRAINAVLGRKLRQSQVAPDRLQAATLALKSAL